MNTHEMWHSFNLGQANQDPGGSWLYAMRYSPDNLADHQETVIKTMQDMGVFVVKTETGLGMGSDHPFDETETAKFMALVEELTVTNEALEPVRLNFFGMTISELAELYKDSFSLAVATGNTRIAAGILKIEIPQLVSDLTRAQFDNSPLSDEDFEIVNKLGDFAASKIAYLMNGGAYISLSNYAPPQRFSASDLPEV